LATGQTGGSRIGCGLLLLVVMVTLVSGLIGGGLGATGVFVALKASPATPTPVWPTAIPTRPAVETSATPQPNGPASVDAGIIQAVRQVGPAVVTVVNTLTPRRGYFGSTSSPEARGSGIIVDSDGHIVTNNHVVSGAQSLSVILASGERREAKLLGSDEYSDLAVIQISGSDLPFAELGDSSSLVPGQVVVAIGSALGDFRNTVTVGFVSGLGRSLETDSGFLMEDLIQTDAAINQGNSGGPLADVNGRVVGINSVIVGRSSGGVVAEGLGFAISADTVRSIAGQIIQTGRVARPDLGITYQANSPRLASYYGLSVSSGILVTRVTSGGPAAKAGVQPGDVIVQIGDQPLDDSDPYVNVLLRYRPGDQVKLIVNRYGQTLTLDVTLGQR
jgi:S1-C subfamily serine protease